MKNSKGTSSHKGEQLCQIILKLIHTVFLLINAPRAMQSIDREPLFCTQFAKKNVCPIVPAVQVFYKIFCQFPKICNRRLQTLSVSKGLKFGVWERVKTNY